jgi:hypothetical protein
MALPTLSVPTFVATIPSTGQEVKYRPFLVKEEKVLLMAMEGRDKNEIRVAINEILKCCVQDEVDFDKLPTFDIEYLFLMLRAKSVGEVISFKIGHSKGDCSHKVDIDVNLNEIKVEGEISDGKIMLDDNIGLKLHYPTIVSLDNLSNKSHDILGVVADCIELVFDEDEVYEDFTKEELVEWLGNLNKEQYKKINEFLESAPKLSHTVEWTCPKCGEKDSMKIEGLYNFFT